MLYAEFEKGIGDDGDGVRVVGEYLAVNTMVSSISKTIYGSAYFAMLRWVKMTPGMHFSMTDSGTLESAQPIQSTCKRLLVSGPLDVFLTIGLPGALVSLQYA